MATGPVTYTIPSIDAAGIVTSAFDWLTVVLPLLVTVLAVRMAPKIVSAARRVFGAASR